MKKLTAYFMTAAILSLFAACKGKDKKVENDPRAVVIAFFERMANKDMEGAAKLATKDSKGTLDMMKKAIDAAEKMGATKDTTDPSEDFKNMVIGDAKIDGDNATVSVTNKAKGDKTNDFPLKKEDGTWKVDFSMATLMKMGMDEAGKDNNWNNTDDTSGVNNNSNENWNADSLTKGLNMLDSALKELTPEKMKEMKEAMKELEKLKQ